MAVTKPANCFRNEIVGKRVMLFKVCSCPKRDMQREDCSFMPRKREASTVSHGKRPTKMSCLAEIKTEPSNPNECPSNSFGETTVDNSRTVTLTMPSKESLQHVLRCAYNEVSGLMAANTNDAELRELMRYAKKIDGLLGKLLEKKNIF